MFTAHADLGDFHREKLRIKGALRDGIARATRAAALAGRDEAKASGNFKDHTGRLRREITAKPWGATADGSYWEIVSPTPYAIFVEAGTRAHPIVARNAPNLVFYWPKIGGLFVGKSVNHPGTAPHPFMGPAHLKAERVLMARLESELDSIASR